MTETQITHLLPAYLRRKRWEQQALAVTIVNTLGEALQGGGKEKTSLAQLALMGFGIRGVRK